mmetsp:Transcript_21867/g.47590  ORF Transcript_21867/g.47590 Transcript_21867/m.47590 type:complete len:279 (+) Transcript_21867:3-839(+)
MPMPMPMPMVVPVVPSGATTTMPTGAPIDVPSSGTGTGAPILPPSPTAKPTGAPTEPPAAGSGPPETGPENSPTISPIPNSNDPNTSPQSPAPVVSPSFGTNAPVTNATPEPSGKPSNHFSEEPSFSAPPTGLSDCLSTNTLKLGTAADNTTTPVPLDMSYNAESTSNSTDAFEAILVEELIRTAVLAIFGCNPETSGKIAPNTRQIVEGKTRTRTRKCRFGCRSCGVSFSVNMFLFSSHTFRLVGTCRFSNLRACPERHQRVFCPTNNIYHFGGGTR